VTELVPEVQDLVQEEDLDVEQEIHRVAWGSAVLVEWDEEVVEEVEVVEI